MTKDRAGTPLAAVRLHRSTSAPTGFRHPTELGERMRAFAAARRRTNAAPMPVDTLRVGR